MLFNSLRRINAAPAFREPDLRRILTAAALLHGLGCSIRDHKSPQKAARNYLLDLPVPAGWTTGEWELLAWAVRYYRGREPNPSKNAFSRLSEEQQKNVRALAGVLRLARALGKSGFDPAAGLSAEMSPDAVFIRVLGLADSEECAARLAAAKHLLDTYLDRPLILNPVPKSETPQVALEPLTALASD